MNARDTTLDEVRPGAILAGRYLVERRIGEGGMGVVVAARHLQLGHRVAIKFLGPSALENEEAVQRFRREAWAAAQIKSPHVVQVSEVADLPNGLPFIVMEYLEGEDLGDVMERQGRLPVEAATGLILQVCEAIAEAHAVGVVHRDLKPSNIFCARDRAGQVVTKVLDFGVSKLMGAGVSDLSITTTRMALGSPLYMSPEQMQSAKAVDERTDIWSIGVILYELLAATHPFDAESLPDLAIKVSTGAPMPLRDANPEVPRGLERVVLRCLEKLREKRFEDVAALARALAPYAAESARQHAVRTEALLSSVSISVTANSSQASARIFRGDSLRVGADRGPTLVLPKFDFRRARFLQLRIPLVALALVTFVAWGALRWASRDRARSLPDARIAASAAHVRTAPRTAVSAPPSEEEKQAPPKNEIQVPREALIAPAVPRPAKLRPPAAASERPPAKRARARIRNPLLLETQELGGRL